MHKQKGFSLIELLIVVAIILIIAAIAIPNLIRARISANQASGVASMRSIGTAEIQYQSNYPQVGYSANLLTLGTGAATNPPTPCPVAGATAAAACLIDGVLTGAATIPKSGYAINEAGQVVAPAVTNNVFVSEAFPTIYDRTGVQSYCMIEDGVVRSDPTNTLSGLQGVTSVACLANPFRPLNN